MDIIPSSVKRPETFMGLLEAIRLRPTMFIGHNDIFCLNAFLNGWDYGDADKTPGGKIMGDFQQWIEKKYKIKTTHGWAQISIFIRQTVVTQ